MKLLTSRNLEYDADWVDGPTVTDGLVHACVRDSRSLPVIAAEFDGLDWLKRESERQGNKEFIGYNVLQHIARRNDGAVLIALGQKAGDS